MALAPRLEFRQSQSLVMTPQLMQAIKLLQLSSLDLASYVEGELEQNPLLHREDEFNDGTRTDSNAEVSTETGDTSAGIEASSVTGRDTHQINSTVRSGGEDDYNLEAFVAEEVNLVDHLMSQLGHIITDPAQMLIARTLIDSIDQAGYMRGDLEEIAESLGAANNLVEETLEALQSLDPPGICARNLPDERTLRCGPR